MVVYLVIFFFFFSVMLVSACIQHCKGDKEIANFHGSVAVEVCWALAPLVIVMQLVWPTVRSVLTP